MKNSYLDFKISFNTSTVVTFSDVYVILACRPRRFDFISWTAQIMVELQYLLHTHVILFVVRDAELLLGLFVAVDDIIISEYLIVVFPVYITRYDIPSCVSVVG